MASLNFVKGLQNQCQAFLFRLSLNPLMLVCLFIISCFTFCLFLIGCQCLFMLFLFYANLLCVWWPLSGFQVWHLLRGVDSNFIKKYVLKTESIFLNCFPVTPNCHRVTEITHLFSNGQRLIFVSIVSFTVPLVLVGLDGL